MTFTKNNIMERDMFDDLRGAKNLCMYMRGTDAQEIGLVGEGFFANDAFRAIGLDPDDTWRTQISGKSFRWIDCTGKSFVEDKWRISKLTSEEIQLLDPIWEAVVMGLRESSEDIEHCREIIEKG